MPNDLTTGLIWSTTLPSWQRDYYSMLLQETLRTKSILVPYTAYKEDFAAAKSGVVVFTEVFDTDPNFNPLTESGIWLSGGALDSRTVSISLEIHGDILKFSDYNEVVQYVNNGDMRGLVREKIGQNQVDYLDLLARNAFLSHPNKNALISSVLTPGGARTSITATDLFDPDICETIRVHLEEHEIPGVSAVQDGGGQDIVCVTTPRVIKDIRTAASSKWLEVQEYDGATRKFNSEVGMWNGIRFVKTNRLRLLNYGAVEHQTTLSGATVTGQGAQVHRRHRLHGGAIRGDPVRHRGRCHGARRRPLRHHPRRDQERRSRQSPGRDRRHPGNPAHRVRLGHQYLLRQAPAQAACLRGPGHHRHPHPQLDLHGWTWRSLRRRRAPERHPASQVR